jgi:two-component system, LytTR family, response regulator
MGNMSQSGGQNKKIVLCIGSALHVVNISEIIICQSERNTTTFFLLDGRKLVTSKNISDYEDMLNEYGFFRPHRQYLISMHHILSVDKTITGTIRMARGLEVPVSRHRKEMLIELFSML